MTAPAHASPEMWKFWLAFKKLCPSCQLGGIFAPKPGYHNYFNALPGSDYSKQLPQDKVKANRNYSSAIDLTMSLENMKKYSSRLLKSGKDPKDPRGNYLREFYGNANGDQYVDGWDFQANCPSSSDSSHLWHIHISILRKHANNPRAFRALLSILKGESVATWRAKEWLQAIPSAFAGKKPERPPVPTAPKVYHTVKAGQTLLGIAKAYKVTFETLQRLNPQKKGHWDDIQIGERIRVK